MSTGLLSKFNRITKAFTFLTKCTIDFNGIDQFLSNRKTFAIGQYTKLMPQYDVHN